MARIIDPFAGQSDRQDQFGLRRQDVEPVMDGESAPEIIDPLEGVVPDAPLDPFRARRRENMLRIQRDEEAARGGSSISGPTERGREKFMGAFERLRRRFRGEQYGIDDPTGMTGVATELSPIAPAMKRIRRSKIAKAKLRQNWTDQSDQKAKKRIDAGESVSDIEIEDGRIEAYRRGLKDTKDADLAMMAFDREIEDLMRMPSGPVDSNGDLDRDAAISVLMDRDRRTLEKLTAFEKEVERRSGADITDDMSQTQKLGKVAAAWANDGIVGAVNMVEYATSIAFGFLPFAIMEGMTQFDERRAGDLEIDDDGFVKMTVEQQEIAEAATKSILSATTQYLIEKKLGDGLRKVGKLIKGKGAGAAVSKGAEEVVKKSLASRTGIKVLEKASLPNILEEIFLEEGAQAVVDSLFDLNDWNKRSGQDDLTAMERVMKGGIEFMKAIPEMAISMSIFGGVGGAVNRRQMIQYMDAAGVPQEVRDEVMSINDPQERAVEASRAGMRAHIAEAAPRQDFSNEQVDELLAIKDGEERGKAFIGMVIENGRKGELLEDVAIRYEDAGLPPDQARRAAKAEIDGKPEVAAQMLQDYTGSTDIDQQREIEQIKSDPRYEDYLERGYSEQDALQLVQREIEQDVADESDGRRPGGPDSALDEAVADAKIDAVVDSGDPDALEARKAQSADTAQAVADVRLEAAEEAVSFDLGEDVPAALADGERTFHIEPDGTIAPGLETEDSVPRSTFRVPEGANINEVILAAPTPAQMSKLLEVEEEADAEAVARELGEAGTQEGIGREGVGPLRLRGTAEARAEEAQAEPVADLGFGLRERERVAKLQAEQEIEDGEQQTQLEAPAQAVPATPREGEGLRARLPRAGKTARREGGEKRRRDVPASRDADRRDVESVKRRLVAGRSLPAEEVGRVEVDDDFNESPEVQALREVAESNGFRLVGVRNLSPNALIDGDVILVDSNPTNYTVDEAFIHEITHGAANAGNADAVALERSVDRQSKAFRDYRKAIHAAYDRMGAKRLSDDALAKEYAADYVAGLVSDAGFGALADDAADLAASLRTAIESGTVRGTGPAQGGVVEFSGRGKTETPSGMSAKAFSEINAPATLTEDTTEPLRPGQDPVVRFSVSRDVWSYATDVMDISDKRTEKFVSAMEDAVDITGRYRAWLDTQPRGFKTANVESMDRYLRENPEEKRKLRRIGKSVGADLFDKRGKIIPSEIERLEKTTGNRVMYEVINSDPVLDKHYLDDGKFADVGTTKEKPANLERLKRSARGMGIKLRERNEQGKLVEVSSQSLKGQYKKVRNRRIRRLVTARMRDELGTVPKSVSDIGSYSNFLTAANEALGVIQPTFGGFHRTFQQLIIDRMSDGDREYYRGMFYDAVRHAYENGDAKTINFLRVYTPRGKVREQTIKDEIERVYAMGVLAVAPLKSSEKTLAALNGNVACPMFVIGNSACWMNACYLTQLGKTPGGLGYYEHGVYTGELLQLSQFVIDELNKTGGLRINGLGDFTRSQEAQLADIIRDAEDRGLKLKMITKQAESIRAVQRIADAGQSVEHITVQPSMDFLWVPVDVDLKTPGNAFVDWLEKNGSSEAELRDMMDKRPASAMEVVRMFYRDTHDREVSVIDGKVMRKYGFSPAQVREYMQQNPAVRIRPRWVVTTPEELIQAVGKVPRSIYTLMHGKVDDRISSEHPGGGIVNFGDNRHRFTATEILGDEHSKRGTADVYDTVNDYIHSKVKSESELKRIYAELKRGTCCQENDSKDACYSCAADCTHVRRLPDNSQVRDELTDAMARKLGSDAKGAATDESKAEPQFAVRVPGRKLFGGIAYASGQWSDFDRGEKVFDNGEVRVYKGTRLGKTIYETQVRMKSPRYGGKLDMVWDAVQYSTDQRDAQDPVKPDVQFAVRPAEEQAAVARLSDAYDRYNEGDQEISTVFDLVTMVEDDDDMPSEIVDAARRYRAQSEEDIADFGMRGDVEEYEDEFTDAVESVIGSTQFAARDAEYMAAVESGDMDAAQRMVDEAARAAGYTQKLYHGSRERDFTRFQIPGRGVTSFGLLGEYDTERHGVFLTDDAEVSAEYAGEAGQVREFYVAPWAQIDLDTGVTDAFLNTIEDHGVNPRWVMNIRDTWELFDDEDGENFVRSLREMAYDSATFVESAPESGKEFRSTVVFDMDQVKSADPVTRDDDGNVIPLSQRFDPEQPDIRFAARPFRSNSEMAIDGMLSSGKVKPGQRKAAGEWVALLTKSGVRGIQQEMDWIGIEDWLKQEKRTTEEVQQFIRDNQVQIEEVTKGEVSRSARELLGGEPSYAKWKLPGGENYREMLVTLPGTGTESGAVSDDVIASMNRQFVAQGMPGIDAEDLEKLNNPTNQTFDMLDDWESRLGIDVTEARSQAAGAASGEVSVDVFRSSHWDEPNVLYHVRHQDFTDSEGRKVLLVEEIQSDWHQKGRKDGYARRDYALVIDGEIVSTHPTQEEAVDAWKKSGVPRADILEPNVGVPDAPFKKTWHEHALKRMMRYAVENGYDVLAWTPGEVQAKRYDLSKQIRRIDVDVIDDGRTLLIEPVSGGTLSVSTDSDGKVVEVDGGTEAHVSAWVGKDLSDVVGKEVATKVMEADEDFFLEGDGLKTDAPGMKGFYDRMLPSAAKKLFKQRVGDVDLRITGQIDDMQVQQTPAGEWAVWDSQAGYSRERFATQEEAQAKFDEVRKRGYGKTTVHSLDVTPEIRERFSDSQPQFAARQGPALTEDTTPQVPSILLARPEDDKTSIGVEGDDVQFAVRTKPDPEKTITAYKLFRTLKTRPGELFPLFIGKTETVPVDQWMDADFIPTKGFATRPGWHAGVLPTAPHLMKKDGTMPTDRVWAEVEISADRDWQDEASNTRTRDIRDRIPEDGFYRFSTSKLQGGAWIIGGSLKVNRILTNEEAEEIAERGEVPQFAARGEQDRDERIAAARASIKADKDTVSLDASELPDRSYVRKNRRWYKVEREEDRVILRGISDIDATEGVLAAGVVQPGDPMYQQVSQTWRRQTAVGRAVQKGAKQIESVKEKAEERVKRSEQRAKDYRDLLIAMAPGYTPEMRDDRVQAIVDYAQKHLTGTQRSRAISKGKTIIQLAQEATKQKHFDRIMAEIEKMREEQAQKEAVSEYKSWVKKVKKMGVRTFPKEQRDGIKSILESVVTKERPEEIQLRKLIDEIRKDPDNTIPDEELDQALRSDGKRIQDMTTDEILYLTQFLKQAVADKRADMKARRRAMQRQRRRDIQAGAINMTESAKTQVRATDMEEVEDSAKAKKGRKGVHFVRAQTYPVAALAWEMDGAREDVLSDIMYRGLLEGTAREYEVIRAYQEALNKFIQDSDISRESREAMSFKGNSKKAKTYKYRLRRKDGRRETIELSLAELMSVYLSSRNEDNLRHILKGGFTVEKRDGRARETYSVTEADLAQMLHDVESNPDAIAMADEIGRIYDTMMKEYINEVSNRLLGYEIADVDQYFPIVTDATWRYYDPDSQENVEQDTKKFMQGGTFDRQTVESIGAHKARQRNASNPIVLIDAFAQLQRSASQTARYYGFAEPMRRLKAFMTGTIDVEEDGELVGEDSVKARMERLFPHYYEAVLDLMRDIEGGGKSRSGLLERNFGRLRNNIIRSVLGWNIPVSWMQVVSYVPSALYLDNKYWSAAIGKPASEEKMRRLSPTLWNRYQGRVDVAMGEATDAAGVKTMLGLKPRIDPMAPISKMDALAIGQIWTAVELETKATKPALRPGTKAFNDHVAQRVDWLLSQTQPTYDMVDRSQLQRNSSWIVRNLVLFSSQRTKNAMQHFKTDHEFFTSKRTRDDTFKWLRAKLILLISMLGIAVINTVREKLFYKKRPGDEHNFATKTAMNLMKVRVGDMPGLGSILSSLVSRFGTEDIVLRELNQTGQAGQRLVRSILKWVEDPNKENMDKVVGAGVKLIKPVARLAGRAEVNAVRDVSGIIHNLRGREAAEPTRDEQRRERRKQRRDRLRR